MEGNNDNESTPEEELLPQASWGTRKSPDRLPATDELEARKILLSGGRAIWLDDSGERIRALDPSQPVGERVLYADVASVSLGTYLLLREGAAERQALHARAFERIGGRASAVRETQLRWKMELTTRLRSIGSRESERELRKLGVHASGQVRSWSSPDVIRPQNDSDFELLLGWLALPIQPSVGHARLLRHEVHLASRELRDRLEAAADIADLKQLERVGHLSLNISDPGFRGMFVTKVLGISPFTEIVMRYEARVPFADTGAQWLE